MRQIHCGTTGTSKLDKLPGWQDLNLGPFWQEVIEALEPGPFPRPLQLKVLGEENALDQRRNLIISAPTNSGKSLIGLLLLLEALRRGKRALLLEPLRALAREKVDELEARQAALRRVLGTSLAVRISTGDYRLEDELPFAPPPGGELIVATPERMETLLRNPSHAQWMETIGAVCVDEAHLISSPQRGLTLEYLLTSLLGLPAPPRLILLSASLGDVAQAQSWLSPCEVIRMEERYPPLEKWVVELNQEEEANQICLDWAAEQLHDPQAQVLIFVYQTRSTAVLAKFLNERLNTSSVDQGILALAYHAQMSQQKRQQARAAFISGQARVMVTTTALALGINLPASHVLVRDNTFPGVGRLSTGELLQMMGRAGRGDRSGTAAVLVKPGDSWQVEELVGALQAEALPGLVSSLTGQLERSIRAPEMPAIAPVVAALLSRWQEGGATVAEVKRFLGNSLGGQTLVDQTDSALNWLESRWLSYREPESERYFLTVLGKKATRSALPLGIAASYAQLLRDLISVDPEDTLLGDWRSLDHLLVLNLLVERPPSLRRYSAKLVQQVEGWCETHPKQAPLLFLKWIRGQAGHSRAEEVLGSLGIMAPKPGKGAEDWSHRLGYLAMLRAIVLWERSQGVKVEDVERRFGVEGLAGIEERWRDELLWLLSGLSKLLDVRTFYFHLKEGCQANPTRVKRVKRCLGQMKQQIYDLQELLKHCSPLGSLLLELRRVSSPKQQRVGFQSIRRLEEAGIGSLKDLVPLGVDDLVQRGIRRPLANQIRAYVRRRVGG